MNVLLVGNYEPDRQESMLRFAECLRRELPAHGVAVDLIRPTVRVGRSDSGNRGAAKWLAYLDKYVFFPAQLKRRLQSASRETLVHITDHSNSVYARYAPEARVLITCHDLLAVRGALGEDTDCPASATGKMLQRSILRGLQRSARVVCDSTATQRDFDRLTGGRRRSQVILLGLNNSFRTLPPAEIDARLAAVKALSPATPFLLHVGSGLRRKNREFILRVFAKMKSQWPGQLVFAGDPLGAAQRALKAELAISDRVVEVTRVSHEILEALYNRAYALVFPSRFEGFGWPIIEAQACGCPVVCSDTTSLPEVAGDGALVRSLDDEAGFVADLLSLRNPARRAELIERGHRNTERFTTQRMVSDYAEVYRSLSAA